MDKNHFNQDPVRRRVNLLSLGEATQLLGHYNGEVNAALELAILDALPKARQSSRATRETATKVNPDFARPQPLPGASVAAAGASVGAMVVTT